MQLIQQKLLCSPLILWNTFTIEEVTDFAEITNQLQCCFSNIRNQHQGTQHEIDLKT